MKKFFLYAAAAVLSLSFAACSSDDDLSSGGGKTITADQVSSYAKLAVAMPKAGVGSRGFTDGGFQFGTAGENKISDIKLVLYSEDGLVVGTGVPVSDYKQDTPNGSNTNIALEEDVVFHLTLEEGAPEPAKVVAFVNLFNGEDEVPAPYDKATLDQLSAGDLKLDKFIDPTNGFAMTNSGYYKGDDYVFAADLDANNMFSNQAAATGAEKAATIYVERVAAKVQIIAADDLGSDSKSTVTGFNITDISCNKVTLQYDIDNLKWGATGLAKSAYTIKKQFDDAKENLSTDWDNFNSASNFRSYWAEGVNYTTPYNGGYLDAETNEVGDDNPLTYITIKNVTKNASDTAYVAEQTYDYAEAAKGNLFNPVIPSTSVIVISEYKVKGSSYNFEDGFYLLYTGPQTFTIYTKSQLAGYLLSRNGIAEVTVNDGSDTYKTDEENANFKFTDYVTVKADADGKYYISEISNLKANGEALDASSLTKTTNARYYSEAKSYFYVPIEHNGKYDDEVEAEGTYGVVRNHSYVLTINKITGLGAPLDGDESGENDPENPKPIVPDPDDLTDAYINASLNVLGWHGVTQDVNL